MKKWKNVKNIVYIKLLQYIKLLKKEKFLNENIDQIEDLGPGKEISELIDNLNFEKNNNNIIIINNDNKNESKLFNNNENVELKI